MEGIVYNEENNKKIFSIRILKDIINNLSEEDLEKELMIVQLFDNFEPKMIPVSQIQSTEKQICLIDFAVRSKIVSNQFKE